MSYANPSILFLFNECLVLLIFFSMVSSACDDDCTGVLLDDLVNLDKAIFSVNLTDVVLAPYGKLSELENTTKQFKVMYKHTNLMMLQIQNFG